MSVLAVLEECGLGAACSEQQEEGTACSGSAPGALAGP